MFVKTDLRTVRVSRVSNESVGTVCRPLDAMVDRPAPTNTELKRAGSELTSLQTPSKWGPREPSTSPRLAPWLGDSGVEGMTTATVAMAKLVSGVPRPKGKVREKSLEDSRLHTAQ